MELSECQCHDRVQSNQLFLPLMGDRSLANPSDFHRQSRVSTTLPSAAPATQSSTSHVNYLPTSLSLRQRTALQAALVV